MKSRKITASFLFVFFLVLFVLPILPGQAYTTTFTAASATITKNTTSSTYEKTIGVSVKWRIEYDLAVENITTVKTYCFTKVSGKTPLLDSATETQTFYTNYTLVTQTFSLNVDEDSLAGSDLTDSCNIAIYIELYNETVVAANKIGSKLIIKPYGDLIAASSSSSSSSSLTSSAVIILVLALSGIGILVVIIFVLRYGQQKNWIPALGLHAPWRPRDTLDYGDRKAWATRFEEDDYLVRKGHRKPGQFKNIVDTKRAMNRDRTTPHRHKNEWDRKTKRS